MTCKSQAPTLNGGRSSNTEDRTSSTSITRRLLMSMVEKILKDKRLLSGRDTTELTRDGLLSILTKQRKKLVRDMIENTDSTSTEHSSSDQDSQCKELPKLCLTILDSEDT
jgi:hypothetical protein